MIGLAHGSRHPGVKPAIDRLLAVVGASQQIEARAAYLDLVEPDLTAVASELAQAGHRAAVVVPLLFTSAFHATVDVPDAIAAAGAAAGIELWPADVLGTGPDVESLLADSLTDVSAESSAEDPVLLYAVGSSDAAANSAVRDLADRLAAARATPVRVGFGTVEPRAGDVLGELAGSRTGTVVILPLFLAPGLLLDPMLTLAAERNWPVLPPLAERAAPLVVRRYQDRASRSRILR